MNSNYYGNFRNNNRNGYYPKKYNAKENKKYIPQANIREVEINSISQTEPSKPKFSLDLKITSQLEAATNDETQSITNLKHELIGTSNNTEDLNEQLRSILTKLEEIDIDKKISEITKNVNETYSKMKKETIDSIMTIKTELEETIEKTANQNSNDLNEIKALFSWQCLSDLRNHLVTLKGEYYAKPIIITSVYEFEKFYESIMSSDLKEKFVYKKSFSEIIHIIYEAFNGKTISNSESATLDDEFWTLVNLFNNSNKKNKTKLKLNLSGSLYRIIKHFRGIPDDIIIEFGDLIPVLNSENKIAKAKRKINTVVNLLYEILSRQIQMSSLSNKIFAYGHIYYGGKSKEIQVKDCLENDIYFDFVELNKESSIYNKLIILV